MKEDSLWRSIKGEMMKKEEQEKEEEKEELLQIFSRPWLFQFRVSSAFLS